MPVAMPLHELASTLQKKKKKKMSEATEASKRDVEGTCQESPRHLLEDGGKSCWRW
jgi:hypothetical protein